MERGQWNVVLSLGCLVAPAVDTEYRNHSEDI